MNVEGPPPGVRPAHAPDADDPYIAGSLIRHWPDRERLRWIVVHAGEFAASARLHLPLVLADRAEPPPLSPHLARAGRLNVLAAAMKLAHALAAPTCPDPPFLFNQGYLIALDQIVLSFSEALHSWGWAGSWDWGPDGAGPLPCIDLGTPAATLARIEAALSILPRPDDFDHPERWCENCQCVHPGGAHAGRRPPRKARGPVVLSDDRTAVVLGIEKGPLTVPQARVVRALLEAGPAGLTIGGLRAISGGAWTVLKRLAKGDPDWGRVVHFPGGKGRGTYRIGPPL